ncbi:MAG: WD40 repeat domain-containing serine/threonine protein kinase [Rubripirellula sp.]
MSIEELVDDFLDCLRRGEQPSIDEFAARHPESQDDARRALRSAKAMEWLGADRSSDSPMPVPSKVGDYRIIREIGRGGMGVVYEAEQESLKRRVAVKILPDRAASNAAKLERFKREAQASAKLHHTNIVPVYEVGYEGGDIFYAMQLIQGESLDQVVADLGLKGEYAKQSEKGDERQRLYRWIANIGLQAAEAMSYAHARGVIHRDIKPSNLMLDSAGNLWVVDFGLAKTDTEALTESGDIIGTFRYISPERFGGDCDERSDIYSLGLTLYELLVGKTAFGDVDRVKLIETICNQSPPAPRSRDGGIPIDLETIILKSIEKDPSHRYRTAEEMAQDLRSFREDKPVRARRVSLGESAWRWARRNRRLAASLVAVFLLVVAIAVGSSIAAVRETGLRQVAESQRDDLRRNLYLSQMNLAGQSAEEPGGIETVRNLISQWDPKVAGIDLRGWEWRYLESQTRQEQFILRGHTESVWAVSWSPDGTRVVSSANDGTLRFWDTKSGELLQVIETSADRSIAWSPTGKEFACGGFQGQVEVWDAERLKLTQTFQGGSDERVLSVDWHPDSTQVVASSRSGVLRVWDLETASELWSRKSRAPIPCVEWSPNGLQIAAASYDGNVQIHDSAGGEVIRELPDISGPVEGVTWSPDSASLATASRDDTIRVWDAASGSLARELSGFEGISNAICWSPDGSKLAAAHSDRLIRIWELKSTSRRPTRIFGGHTSDVMRICWSPSSRRIASASVDQTVRFWDLGSSTGARVTNIPQNHRILCADLSPDRQSLAAGLSTGEILVWHQTDIDPITLSGHVVAGSINGVFDVRWSPNSRRLLSAGHDRTVRIWDVANRTATAVFGGHGDRVWSCDWNSDTTRIVSSGSDRTVRIWDVDSGLLVHELDGGSARGMTVDWNPVKPLVAMGDGRGNVRIWDTSSGELVVNLDTHRQIVRCVRWSPDGNRLASASDDMSVRVWDAVSGQVVAHLDSHTGGVRTVAWSSHRSRPRLGAGCDNGTIKVWDLNVNRVTITLRGHENIVSSVLWTPDGQQLISAGWNGAIRTWGDSGVRSDVSSR